MKNYNAKVFFLFTLILGNTTLTKERVRKIFRGSQTENGRGINKIRYERSYLKKKKKKIF